MYQKNDLSMFWNGIKLESSYQYWPVAMGIHGHFIPIVISFTLSCAQGACLEIFGKIIAKSFIWNPWNTRNSRDHFTYLDFHTRTPSIVILLLWKRAIYVICHTSKINLSRKSLCLFVELMRPFSDSNCKRIKSISCNRHNPIFIIDKVALI